MMLIVPLVNQGMTEGDGHDGMQRFYCSGLNDNKLSCNHANFNAQKNPVFSNTG